METFTIFVTPETRLYLTMNKAQLTSEENTGRIFSYCDMKQYQVTS